MKPSPEYRAVQMPGHAHWTIQRKVRVWRRWGMAFSEEDAMRQIEENKVDDKRCPRCGHLGESNVRP